MLLLFINVWECFFKPTDVKQNKIWSYLENLITFKDLVN